MFLSLKKFCRLLKPGGRLLLTTPNPGFLLRPLTGDPVVGGSDPSHLSEHSPRELSARLKECGFVRIRCGGSGRVTRLLGDRFPVFSVYGSYLLTADKP